VTVLEARDRLGGRVLTVRRPFAGGQHGEAGGEFIDRNHSRMQAYAREFGIDLEDVRRGLAGLEDIVYRRRRPFRAGAYEREARRGLGRYAEAARGLSRGVDPADPVAGRRARRIDTRSAADLLDRLRVRGRARFLLETMFRDDYGVEPERLSLLYVAQAESLYRNVPGSGLEQFRIRGGNDLLVEAFAARLARPVVKQAPVAAIARAADAVAVTARGRVFEADRCVVAAPLPALRGIAFDPPLPGRLAEAVERLQYARVVKCLLQYPRREWRRNGDSGTASTDLAAGALYEATDQQPGRRGILIAYAAAARSRRLERLRQGARLERAARAAEEVLQAGRPSAGASRAWAEERFSGGTWCAFAPGQVTAYWRALRTPAGPLHFAGEQTSEFVGYMEGAVRSGERAAAEVAGAAAT
jgi:monoamine oxidase